MAEIVIERLTDEHDCDTCGSSYAEGARVWIDGHEAFTLVPVAYCYDGAHFTEEQVLTKVLEYLGHIVTEMDS